MSAWQRTALGFIFVAIASEAIGLFLRRDENTPDPRHAWEACGSFLGFITVGAVLLPFRWAAYGTVAAMSPLTWDTSLIDTEGWILGGVGLYVLADLCYYAKHRWLHATALGRSLHDAHHSADRLTLFVAIRLSWTERVAADVFFLPLALVGAPAWLTLAVIAANHMSPFLSHTTLVPPLPLLDAHLNTPAVHRVHHLAGGTANLGASFMWWDRLFGTYCAPGDTPTSPPPNTARRRGVLALQFMPLIEWLRAQRLQRKARGGASRVNVNG